MIRVACLGAILAVSACGGPSAPDRSGVARDCEPGPRISGTAEIGASDRGLVSGVEGLTISLGSGSTFGGTCAGARYGR